MLQSIISIIFYIAFILYVYLGVYCFALNKAASLNRVFFLVCMTFSIWAFSFAISNSLHNPEAVLVWRRIAAFGWGVAFSLIVHFILILTENQKILTTKGVFPVLYLPAVVSVFVFGVYSDLANKQYQLVQTPMGWGNIPVNNIWDILYNLYYISFSLLTLALLLNWYQRSTDISKKKQAIWVILSFTIAIAFGTITEMLLNNLLSLKIPSIAPIIILIPVIAFAYNIIKYGIMAPTEEKTLRDARVILNDATHLTFMRYISTIYLSASILNLFQYFFYDTELWGDMVLSTIYLLMGITIFLLTISSLSTVGQDRILTIILALTIPITMLRFHFNPMSNVLWAVPLILMMMTIIFSYKKMFWLIATISTIIGLLIWLYVPDQQFTINSDDYLGRLVLYCLAIMLAAFINRIYINRLKENDRQVGFQKMISRVTTNFVGVSQKNLEEKIIDLLKQSGSLINADRSSMGLYSDGLKTVEYLHEWTSEGIMPILGHTGTKKIKSMKWSRDKLRDNKIIFIPSPDQLPVEAMGTGNWFGKQQVYSMLVIPIRNPTGVIGFIRFDQIEAGKNWQVEDHELLRVLANILSDAFAKVENEKEMNHRAYYDALTGLPNRTLFTEKLDTIISQAKSDFEIVGVVFVDLDGFKEINDTMGHDWGDHLLCEIGKRLTSSIWATDTVARFGGDEFLIMIPGFSERQDLEAIVDVIMGVFNHSVMVNDQEFHITASAGVAVYPEDGETVQALIKNADLAISEAKTNGKNKYAFCSEAMKVGALEKMTLTNSLYRALERQELFLHYQPQVCIKTQKVIGFEALLRWQHPEWGMISPAVFIPLAEQTGLINTIGEWVLMTACEQNKAWQNQGHQPVQMAVNLSLEQFRSGHVEKLVASCLKKTGLEPRYLELEITEGIAMRESDYVIECLHKLKQLGVTISIDDFGTEFSSLGRLKDLPVDRLKIDMQFIRGIGINTKDEAIIAVMIHLAKRLNLKVIAEGVETREQMLFLRDEDCDEIQGYFYYKPMSVNEIETTLHL